MASVMKHNQIDIAEYILFIIDEFATMFGLTEHQAFRYIKIHGGLDFIEKNYGIIHTLDDREAVESVAQFCKRNGGLI